MITSSAWRGKRYAVLGLARSGADTLRALLAGEAIVTAWDNDAVKVGALQDELGHDAFDASNPEQVDLTGFAGVVVSPGVPLNHHPIAAHAAKHGVPVIGDIELFAQARAELPPHKVVGITGTNGKSTTTALVHHILKTAGVPTTMGGNIGLPIFGQEPLPEGGVYVLELSSYQIDLTFSLDCDVAVLLNITPDHLDRYDDVDAYAASKARLFAMQRGGTAIFPSDTDDLTTSIKAHCHTTWRTAPIEGMIHGLFHRGDHMIDLRGSSGNVVDALNFMITDGGWLNQSEWPSLQGPHNAQNAAVAFETCRALGLANAAIEQGLRTYPGLPHRMERVRTLNGVLYVNDSKATNADSTAPALAAYPKIRWILGGQAKTHDLDACAPHFSHVRSAHTIGEAGAMFADILRPHMPVEECGTLDKAVTSAAKAAEAGDTVLLSPACASFDQFKDFEDRGDTFRHLVEAL